MVCLGFEPGAAGWKVQTNPLSISPNNATFNFSSTLLAARTTAWFCRAKQEMFCANVSQPRWLTSSTTELARANSNLSSEYNRSRKRWKVIFNLIKRKFIFRSRSILKRWNEKYFCQHLSFSTIRISKESMSWGGNIVALFWREAICR